MSGRLSRGSKAFRDLPRTRFTPILTNVFEQMFMMFWVLVFLGVVVLAVNLTVVFLVLLGICLTVGLVCGIGTYLQIIWTMGEDV